MRRRYTRASNSLTILSLAAEVPSVQPIPQTMNQSVTVEALFIKLCASPLTLMTLLDICPADWRPALCDVLTSVTAHGIANQLAQELASGHGYYPRFDRLFAALEGLRPSDVRW